MSPNMRHFKGEPRIGENVVTSLAGWSSGLRDGVVCALFDDQVAVKLEQGGYVVVSKDKLYERALTQLPNGECVFKGDRVYGAWRGAGKTGFIVDAVDSSSGHLCCSGMVLTSDATRLSLTPPTEEKKWLVIHGISAAKYYTVLGPYTEEEAHRVRRLVPHLRQVVKSSIGE